MQNLTLYSTPGSGDPAEDRINFLGGSDTGTILGLNPYKSAYTLWLEKTGQVEPPDLSDKTAVKVGHAFEEGVAKMYEAETGHTVEESLMNYMCKEYPFLRAHVDRLLVDDTDRGLECKTTSSRNNYDYLNGEVPPYYYSQCQFYMMLTGRNHWDLATLKDNTDFFINPIDRDDEYIETMLNAMIEFWDRVQTRTPPPVDGSYSTQTSLGQIFKGGSKKVADLFTVEDEIDNYLEALEQEKYWRERKTEAENNIKVVMGDCEKGISTIATVTWKSQSGKLDSKKVKKLLSTDDYISCMGPSIRVLKVKPIKEKE